MIAIVCPGQGAQTPGFLSPWLELDAFRSKIEALSQSSGIDLIKHGTISDADTIRDTAVAQPLIVSAGIASAHVLLAGQSAKDAGVSGIAGHSVGEITAAAVAGVFSGDTAMKFVVTRGNAMAGAAALEQTSMAAVLGGAEPEVLSALAALDLEPANRNGAGQIVAAGSAANIAELQANPPAGSRVIALQVAGAFHTRFMQPAVSNLADFAESVESRDPEIKLWSNSNGEPQAHGKEFVEQMVRQVSNPVRWDLCMASMVSAGVTALIELSPAGTLVGLAKRAMPGVETVAVKTPENIEAALSVINNHR
jgi:[acyl-carrier-protein] S-malonyltransferase